MDLITVIITSLVTLLGGGVAGVFINKAAAKKKPEIENLGLEIQNEAASVAAMKDAIEEIRKSNDHFQEIHEKDEETISGLRREMLDKDTDLTLCQSMLCKNMCCQKRKPITGKGKAFFEKLKAGEEELNFEPVE